MKLNSIIVKPSFYRKLVKQFRVGDRVSVESLNGKIFGIVQQIFEKSGSLTQKRGEYCVELCQRIEE